MMIPLTNVRNIIAVAERNLQFLELVRQLCLALLMTSLNQYMQTVAETCVRNGI